MVFVGRRQQTEAADVGMDLASIARPVTPDATSSRRSSTEPPFLTESFVQIGALLQAREQLQQHERERSMTRGLVPSASQPAVIGEVEDPLSLSGESNAPRSKELSKFHMLALLLALIISIACGSAAVHFKQEAGLRAAQLAASEARALELQTSYEQAKAEAIAQRRRAEESQLQALLGPGDKSVSPLRRPEMHVINTCFLRITLGECGTNLVHGAGHLLEDLHQTARHAFHAAKSVIVDNGDDVADIKSGQGTTMFDELEDETQT
ncbi:hypothetical protein JKP88DRAFT_268044 [Tribonema minus]|uniref:Uncharacterized protein n=1 Tax=Tribonema minus TaxID=303371 RepID=A0A835Z3Q3_9STRA|nr:hypothetical protein JKP88DRAFT_268044 [Tribonema minus]